MDGHPGMIVYASTLTTTFSKVALVFSLCPFSSTPAHDKFPRKHSATGSREILQLFYSVRADLPSEIVQLFYLFSDFFIFLHFYSFTSTKGNLTRSEVKIIQPTAPGSEPLSITISQTISAG